MTSIIKPNLDYTGKIATDDIRYQIINWTDEYLLKMMAWTEDGQLLRYAETFDNEEEAVAKMWEMREGKMWMGQVFQKCILGDGSVDFDCVAYTGSVCKYYTEVA